MTFPPADWRINVAIWSAIAIAVVTWQLITIRAGRFPTFGDLVRLARRSWVLRWGLVVFWIWLGWHFVVRTSYHP